MEKTSIITLPKWLDDLIFNEMGAQYCRQNSTMTNIDDDKDRALNYLGTYFPRSYAEAYTICGGFFQKYKDNYNGKTELKIFDFGCGTGGEIIGLLTAIEENLPEVKKVRIVALDGNHHALLLFEEIVSNFKQRINIEIECCPVHLHINFYKLEMLDYVMTEQFDMIISFKAICEFVTKKQFEELNPYEHLANFMRTKMKADGIMVLEDITTKDEKSSEWLPDKMDRGLLSANCNVVAQNVGYNQIYCVTHSHANDKSKIAWRIITK